MSLDRAMQILEMEIEDSATAKPGSTLWYLRQAKSLGLSMLKSANVRGASEPDALNQYRAGLRKELQPTETVPVEEPTPTSIVDTVAEA